MKKKKERKRMCSNCKFSGVQFKILKLTHLHCEDPEVHNEETCATNDFSGWETLRVFSDTCENHNFKSLEN